MNDSSRDSSLSEQEAALVLERATQLEAHEGSTVDVEELRAVALDAGIAVDAFERALAEVRASLSDTAPKGDSAPTSDPPVATPGGLTTWVRRAGLGALGFVIATASAALSTSFGVDADAAAIFSIVLGFFIALGLATTHRKDRAVAAYLFDLAALWIGFTLSWMLTDPGDAFGVLTGTGLIGAVAAVAGAALVGLRSGDEPSAHLTEADTALLPEPR